MNKNTASKRIWLLPVLWTALIFYMSAQSGDVSGAFSGSLTANILKFLSSLGLEISFEQAHFLIRKAAHFTEYLILALLVNHASEKAPLWKSNALMICIWMVCTPAADETIQHFISGRFGAFSDVCLDIAGFVCGVIVYHLLKRRR